VPISGPSMPGPPMAEPPASLDRLLSRTAALTPDLLVDGSVRMSGRDVERATQRCAGGLTEAGVDVGDVVAWRATISWQTIVLLRACWRIGAVAAPLHQRLGEAEAAQLAAGLAHTAGPVTLVDVDALPDGGPVLSGTRPVPATGRALILHTAGSSGPPKAVIHTHAALTHKARQMVDIHALTPDDVVFVPTPLAHISGILYALLVPAATPMRAVLINRWDAALGAELIEAERVTFMVGPPTFFNDLAGTERALSSLRLISCGGAGVTAAFCEATAERFGAVVKRTYGSTEAPSVATAWAGDPIERGWNFDGRAVAGVELRIGDADELLVRGPELFSGYTDGAATAAAVDEDGWFHTGDRASIDADGWLTITGRLKELIIRGGENVSPADVEAQLLAHPSVRAASVIGVPDGRLGERVGALVVADASFDLAECRRWFSERGVARYQWPERIEHVDAIPLLASGKPDRLAVAELMHTD